MFLCAFLPKYFNFGEDTSFQPASVKDQHNVFPDDACNLNCYQFRLGPQLQRGQFAHAWIDQSRIR